MSIPVASKPAPHETPKDLALLRSILNNYGPASVDATMSPTDTMIGHNYMWVGVGAAEVITTAVMASKLTEVKTILDLPCGHGRVLRHLVKMFPDAKIDACDLDKEGVQFCADTFGARPIFSQEDLTKVEFDTKYDLIWIGSLFTHTSRSVTEKWLAFLTKLLSQNGIIVATFHGRFAPKLHCLMPYVDEGRWRIIYDGYIRTGYGYADYAHDQSHDFIEGSYGLSVTRPSTLIDIVNAIPGVRVHAYLERAWANNHDVIAFGPPVWDQGIHWPVVYPDLIPEPASELPLRPPEPRPPSPPTLRQKIGRWIAGDYQRA